MAITREEVRRVATLARLRLEPDEETRLTADLDHILKAFERLQAVDTTQVPPMAHVDEASHLLDQIADAGLGPSLTASGLPSLRDDVVRNPAAGDEALANTPARDGRRFRVPKIIE